MARGRPRKDIVVSEEIKEEQVFAPKEESVEIPEKPRIHKVGSLVLFHKLVPKLSGGTELLPQAAIISGTNPPGNFQIKDKAVSLWIFPSKPGAGLEAKHGVLFSEKPQEGRWTWPE